jgi:hypothetical protein
MAPILVLNPEQNPSFLLVLPWGRYFLRKGGPMNDRKKKYEKPALQVLPPKKVLMMLGEAARRGNWPVKRILAAVERLKLDSGRKAS